MPIIPIDNIGAIGLVSDIPSRELLPEAWSNAGNIRFQNKLAEKSHGEEAALGTPNVAPKFAIPAPLGGVTHWVYADGVSIHKTDGSTHTDITRTASAYNGGTYPQWNGCVLGGVLLLNNTSGADVPQQWDSGTTKMKDLTNWPAGTYAKVIRSFKQFAVALDISDGTGNHPYTVRWSHPADPGTVPTSWDVSDATKDTGEVPLSETPDTLVDCLPLGNINIIYKERTCWAMQYVGGQAIFAFRRLPMDFGLLAQNCVVEIPQGHFVVTRGDVRIHNGQTSKSIVDDKIRRRLFNTMSQEYSGYTSVAVNAKYNEVWIFYVNEGNTTPLATKALIWNWEENTWTDRAVPSVAFASNGIFPQTIAAKTFDTSSGVTFDADAGAFDQSDYPTAEDRLIMCSPEDTAFYMVDQTYLYNGSAYDVFLERIGLGIVGRDRQGQWKVNQEAVKFIRNIYPKVSADPGVIIDIYLGIQLKPNDPIEWSGPYTFDPETDTKIDCTLTTKLIGIRFSSRSVGFWKLYGYDIDMDVTARY